MLKILIINQDKNFCKSLLEFLTNHNFEAKATHTPEEALKLLLLKDYDLILCGDKLPRLTLIEFMAKLKPFDMATIVMAAFPSLKDVTEAFHYGVYDYMVRPFELPELLSSIEKIGKGNRTDWNTSYNSNQSQELRPKVVNFMNTEFSIGKSALSKGVQYQVNLVAPSGMSVIIEGETGTGKEFVAHSIHSSSSRTKGPFMAIDCGALSDELAGSELFGHVKGAFTGAVNDKLGVFEMAKGGTVFLDEIGNLLYENQVKLLRVIQERTIKPIGSTKEIAIDVRIISATNINLRKAVTDGLFREDLYHRLNEFKIALSPLRERKADILFFAECFLKKSNELLGKKVKTFSIDVRRYLANYSWPGNLRELGNVIKRAVLLSTSDMILYNHLPQEVLEANYLKDILSNADLSASSLKSISLTAERKFITDTLEKTSNNKSRASRLLNIDRKTLYNKLKLVPS